MSEENQEAANAESGGEAENQESQSLLGEAENKSGLEEGEWWLSDGVKGSGERPESFMHDKYATYTEQAKAYPELQKKFGSFTGTPKDGYDMPENIEEGDALFQSLVDFADEAGMNQDGFNKAWELLSTQNAVSEEVRQEEELKKLGDNPSQRTQVLEAALKNKLGDRFEDVRPLINSADSVMLAEMLMKAYAPPKLPIDGGEVVGGLTWADIEVEMNKKDENGRFLRSTDTAHNAKVERLMKEYGGDRVTKLVVG